MPNITLQLQPQTEKKLRERAGHFGQSLEDYLQCLAEREAELASRTEAAQMPFEEWSKLWHEWCSSHPELPGTADDSRESIYEGRGE